MRYFCHCFLLLCSTLILSQEQEFNFEFEGRTLNGILTQPNEDIKGMVIIVHGSGRTKAVAQNWHADIRAAINKAGYATYMFDKQGCGKSEGTFDYNQPVQNSAEEVIAAINALKKGKIPGTQHIGLWGISRAGWINPLVIEKYPDIVFWISTSGVYARENFNYLLKENLMLEGIPKDSVDLIVKEWAEGNRIVHHGGSYEVAQMATKNLRKTKFLKRFNNGNEMTREAYESFQKKFMLADFDSKTGQQIYIPDFENVLSQIKVPVLAIFGEKDKNVDWKLTKSLYERSMGLGGGLTIKTYPNANHNLFECKTGGFFEFQDNDLTYRRPAGYLEDLTHWLLHLND